MSEKYNLEIAREGIRKAKEIIDTKKELGICCRCKKNKATINFTQSVLDFTHGFVERICQECYDKIREDNIWFQEGKKEGIQSEKMNKEKVEAKLKEVLRIFNIKKLKVEEKR